MAIPAHAERQPFDWGCIDWATARDFLVFTSRFEDPAFRPELDARLAAVGKYVVSIDKRYGMSLVVVAPIPTPPPPTYLALPVGM